MSLSGSTDQEKLVDLASQTYRSQGIWFLNAYWHKIGADGASQVWDYVAKFGELDLEKKAEGHALDEMQAHRFLEAFDMTLTVRKMREGLRQKGAIGDKVNLIALVHYLLVHYDEKYEELVNASQGDNSAEIEMANTKLKAVQVALAESQAKADAAREATSAARASEAAAKKREEESVASEQEAKAREADALAAQREQEAALAELQAQEKAYNDKTTDLTARSEQGGVVTRNKAKNELAQHLAEDPLPLRRAKIDNEAAVRKAERATKAAAAARAAAEAARAAAAVARTAAEASRAAAEEAERAAEAAVADAQAKVEEAEAFLAEIKKKPGRAEGAIWFMERELYEAKKYLPLSKGGVAR